MNNKGLRKGYFSIDGMKEEENVVEGYTDGSTWNGWAEIALKQDQIEKLYKASPFDFRYCEVGHKFNPYPRPLFIVYNGLEAEDDLFVAQDYQDDQGEWFQAFPMGGYCFVELEKKETGFEPVG